MSLICVYKMRDSKDFKGTQQRIAPLDIPSFSSKEAQDSSAALRNISRENILQYNA